MLKIDAKNPNAKEISAEYALYSMLTLYFRKTVCLAPSLEKRMSLYYADIREADQLRLEEKMEELVLDRILPVTRSRGITEDFVVTDLLPYQGHFLIRLYGPSCEILAGLQKKASRGYTVWVGVKETPAGAA